MVQTSRLVLEIDSRDAKQEAADTRRALEALEEAGIRVKPAMDKAGAGIEGAGKSAGKATKSLQEERAEIEHLLESINPLTKKLNDLEKQEAALNKARKSGKIELDTYNEYSARLSATRAELGRFNESLGKTGVSAKQTAAALRGVPAQFTDIAVSLQGGQAPLTVFLQQGGQLKDMFGGIGPAAKALGGYIVGLVNPLTVGAAAAGALGAVFYDAEKQVSAFNKSLFSGTASSGQTAASLAAISKTVSSITGDISEANAAVITLAGSSKLSQTQFVNLAQASASISEFTGKSAAEVAKSLGDIGESATKAAEKISSQYGLLTSAQYDVISALDEQGKKQEALDALSGFLNENAQKRLAAYKASLSDIERDWNNIGTAISNAYSRVKAELFPDLTKQAEIIERILKTREDGGVTGAISTGLSKLNTALGLAEGNNDDSTEALKTRLGLIRERLTVSQQTALVDGEAGKADQIRIAAESKWNSEHKSSLAGLAKLEDEISEKRKLGLAAGRSQVEIDKEVAALREKYEKSLPKPNAYTEDAGIKALDQAKQQYAVLMQQASLIDQQGAGTKALGAAAKDLIQWEQQIADIKSKQTLTADQKALLANQELITAQLKRNAGLEKENELRKIANAEAAKLLSFTESINDKLALSQQGLSNQLAGIGLGQEGRKRLQDDLKIRQDYQKDMDKLQAQFNSGDLSKELYEKETAMLEDALGKRLSMQEDYYTQLEKAQSDWTNGANAAWQDYVYEAGDIAGQTYDLFDNAFRGMEDSLVDFVTGGKLSFKDLADSIIADIARIIIKTQVVTPLLNSLFGGGAGGTGGGIASLLSGSGGSGASGGANLESVWNGVSGAYSVATSGFGQAVSSGWSAGEGFLGGVQGAFKAGAGQISAATASLFASSGGTMVNGVYQLSASAAPATVDLISNTVTNSSTGAVTGTATGATTAASAGLSASSAVMYGIGGAIQGYLKAGVKGAVAGAGGAVAGAYAGAAIGSAIPVIGTAIGAAVGAVLGGMFGSSLFGGDWITKDQGFQLGVTDGKLESNSFEYQKKKGGLFSSNKKRTRLTAMDPEMQEALDKTYAVTLGSVIGLFDSLDVELNDAVLDGLNVAATQISTRDKTAEQIQEELAKWFTGLGDAAVAEVNKVTGSGLDGFNLQGLTTFVNNLYSVNASFDMIGVKMVDFNIAGGRAVENLVALAGGIEALNQNMTKFYDGFTTDTQKSIDVLDGVRAQFKALGLTLPATREAFAETVKGLDMTSQAEREIFNSMTANSEQAAAAYTILEQRQAAYYAGFYSESENTSRSIGELTDSLKKAGITLPAARNGFRDLVEAASKDTTEAGKKMYETLMNLAGKADSAYDLMESSADAAAQAMSEALMSGVSNAMSAVQRAVDSEKNSITAAYNAQVASLNAASSTLGTSISSLTTIGSSLESALKSLTGTSDEAVKMLYAQARAVLDNALATARAGGSLDGFTGLNYALDTVSSNNTDLYSSLEDFNRDQGRTANVVAELNAINGVQLSTQEKSLEALEDQLELVKKDYEAQIKSLDDQALYAQSQLDALNGVDTSIMSVTAAVNAMNAAVVAALAARPAGSAAANTTGNNSTLLDTVYQQILGRDTDTAGAAYWGGLLQSGAIDYAGLVAAITNDAKANGELKQYATGGLITGPGTGTSDSILARLSAGEYVMNAAAVSAYGTDLLDSMNSGIRLVGAPSAASDASRSAGYGASRQTAGSTGSAGDSSEMVERQSWTNRLLNQLIQAVNKQTRIGMPVYQVNQ